MAAFTPWLSFELTVLASLLPLHLLIAQRAGTAAKTGGKKRLGRSTSSNAFAAPRFSSPLRSASALSYPLAPAALLVPPLTTP